MRFLSSPGSILKAPGVPQLDLATLPSPTIGQGMPVNSSGGPHSYPSPETMTEIVGYADTESHAGQACTKDESVRRQSFLPFVQVKNSP